MTFRTVTDVLIEAERDKLKEENTRLRAELDHIKEVEFPSRVEKVVEGWRGKCERLQAELDALKSQEPVGVFADVNRHVPGQPPRWEQMVRESYDGVEYVHLYAAQVPSVPEAVWLPIPDEHPTFEIVDLLCADRSILCGCVPQVDGDYWWESPVGAEIFIDPKYARVTHWRLAAAPKPGEGNG